MNRLDRRRHAVQKALELPLEASARQHTVDITTIGARTGRPRRIEIWFHYLRGRWYLSGMPGPKAWVANLIANPAFTFHLTHGVRADLPAQARPIRDLEERRIVFTAMLEVYNLPANPARIPQPIALRDLLPDAPLLEVTFAVPPGEAS